MQKIQTIELTDGNIVLHLKDRQFLLKGDFLRRTHFSEIKKIIAGTDVKVKIEGKYKEVLFHRIRNVRFLQTQDIYSKKFNGYTSRRSYVVIDFRSLPLFIYKFKSWQNGIYTIVVVMSENNFFMLHGPKLVIQATLPNLINQGAYSLAATQMITTGGRIWFAPNIDQRCDNLNKLLRHIDTQKFSGPEGLIISFSLRKLMTIHSFNISETLHKHPIKQFANKRKISILINAYKKRLKDLTVNPFGYITYLKKTDSHYGLHNSHLVRSNISIPDITQKPIVKEFNTGGLASSIYKAKIKAYIEAAERYCSGDVASARIEYGKVKDIRTITERFLGYSTLCQNKKFPRTPYISHDLKVNKKYPCVKAFEFNIKEEQINLNSPILLPLDVVYYPVKGRSDHRFAYANSSGCAGHICYGEAIKNAALELMERDSLMLMWINKLSLPRIKISSLPKHFRSRILEIEKASSKTVVLLDATLDKNVPHIIACLIDKHGKRPFFHIGAGAALNLKGAISKALNEIETPVFFSNVFKIKKSRSMRPEEVSNVRDHYMFYHDPTHANEINFILKGDEIPYSSVLQQGTFEKMIRLFHGWYVIDLTDAHFAKLGIYVVRVLNTELVPIWFGNKCVPLLKRRIKSIHKTFQHFVKDKKKHEHLFLHPMG